MKDSEIRKMFEYLAKYQKLDPETALRVLHQILEALQPSCEDP